MTTTEAHIKITRNDGRLTSISVSMPVWHKFSEQGNLLVKLPLLDIDTIAKDEDDIDKAVEEAIGCFCIAAERFGNGVEIELEALGWVCVSEDDKPLLGFNAQGNPMMERFMRTGETYVNPHLEIAA